MSIRTRHRFFLAAAAALIATPSLTLADTLGYWRFENTPGFLADSGPGGRTLSTAGTAPTSTTLAGGALGSSFPNPIPQTKDANGIGATFSSGGRFRIADEAALYSNTFSAELYLAASSYNTSTKSLVGQWNATGSQRAWLFSVSSTQIPALLLSTTGGDTITVTSGLPALQVNKDYYLAVTVDLSDATADGITFYMQNLTDGDPLLVDGQAHLDTATSIKNSTAGLTIGSTDQPSSPFTGLIDEVRVSNVKLSQSELLNVPEPSTLGLAVGVGMMALSRRRTQRR